MNIGYLFLSVVVAFGLGVFISHYFFKGIIVNIGLALQADFVSNIFTFFEKQDYVVYDPELLKYYFEKTNSDLEKSMMNYVFKSQRNFHGLYQLLMISVRKSCLYDYVQGNVRFFFNLEKIKANDQYFAENQKRLYEFPFDMVIKTNNLYSKNNEFLTITGSIDLVFSQFEKIRDMGLPHHVDVWAVVYQGKPLEPQHPGYSRWSSKEHGLIQNMLKIRNDILQKSST